MGRWQLWRGCCYGEVAIVEGLLLWGGGSCKGASVMGRWQLWRGSYEEVTVVEGLLVWGGGSCGWGLLWGGAVVEIVFFFPVVLLYIRFNSKRQ